MSGGFLHEVNYGDDHDASTHAIHRAAEKLAIGVARDVSSARDADAPYRVDERWDMFQVQAQGIAGDDPIWQFGDLPFDNVYTKLDGRRNSDLQRPQIMWAFEQTVGVSATSGLPLTPIIPTLIVTDWAITDDDRIEGCSFAVCALAPGDSVRFDGFFHLTIQGFGSPSQDSDTGD